MFNLFADQSNVYFTAGKVSTPYAPCRTLCFTEGWKLPKVMFFKQALFGIFVKNSMSVWWYLALFVDEHNGELWKGKAHPVFGWTISVWISVRLFSVHVSTCFCLMCTLTDTFTFHTSWTLVSNMWAFALESNIPHPQYRLSWRSVNNTMLESTRKAM